MTLRLTGRQLHVGIMWSNGVPEKEMAAKLGISSHTVKGHKKAIKERLGTTRSSEAIRQIMVYQREQNIA